MGPGIRERERVMQNQLLSVCTRGPALPAAWEEEKRQLWPLTSDTSWPGGLGCPGLLGGLVLYLQLWLFLLAKKRVLICAQGHLDTCRVVKTSCFRRQCLASTSTLASN